VIVLPFLSQLAYSELYVISLTIGLVAVIILAIISGFMDSKKLARFYYPLSLVGISVVGFLILYFISPSTANSMLGKFRVFTPDQSGLTIAEVRPLLFVGGKFTLSPLWNEFNTTIITAVIAFVILIVGFFRKFDSAKLLILLWTVFIFVATISQVRFAAYLAVVMATLSGYFYAEVVSLIKRLFTWLSRGTSKASSMSSAQTKHKSKKGLKLASDKNLNHPVVGSKTTLTGSLLHKITAISVCVLVVFLAGIYPSIKPAMATAGSVGGISAEWRESLLWMKSNTPEPFQNADFYYQLYNKPASGTYAYPSSAYGVMAWWDYGHMITQIAHRIPNTNPNQSGASSAAAFFISQNEADSTKLLDELGSKYIILDYPIALPFDISNNMIFGQKFYAMPTFTGKDPNLYSEILYQPKDNLLTPLPVYYPEYYYCLSTRLFNFHAAAAVPQNSTTVISFTVQSGRKVIQTTQTFATYEEAAAFMKGHPTDNYRIVGTSPFISPVPLEKLSHYQEVYKSPSGIVYNGQKTNSSYIEIFEYTP
jgi:asparagine N-glycosylation enzyme membrane subunit Stt3